MAGERPRHAAPAAATAAAGLRRAARRRCAVLRARSSSRWLGASRIRSRVRAGLGGRDRLRLGGAYQAKFHRLAALILLGGAGLVTCISFVWLSAPDLALTQLVVETVTTVLLLLGLRWLPKRIQDVAPSGTMASMIRWYRVRDFVIAVGAGSGLAALAYASMTRPPPDSISRFFVENAYMQGGGTNIVNVILVDFRGFDTLGEITVLGVVALTVYALLRRFRPAPESIPVPEQQRAQDIYDEAHPDREKGHRQERHGDPRADHGAAFSQ